jgi:hypothetical protein
MLINTIQYSVVQTVQYSTVQFRKCSPAVREGRENDWDFTGQLNNESADTILILLTRFTSTTVLYSTAFALGTVNC